MPTRVLGAVHDPTSLPRPGSPVNHRLHRDVAAPPRGAISLDGRRRSCTAPPAPAIRRTCRDQRIRQRQTETTKLTQATYDRLVAELEDLTTRGRVEIAQPIESARALGDLSENGDYHAAKDSQGKMESRIRQLQALLKKVEMRRRDRARATAVVAHGQHGDPPLRR